MVEIGGQKLLVYLLGQVLGVDRTLLLLGEGDARDTDGLATELLFTEVDDVLQVVNLLVEGVYVLLQFDNSLLMIFESCLSSLDSGQNFSEDHTVWQH